jgi:hypothetical protein
VAVALRRSFELDATTSRADALDAEACLSAWLQISCVFLVRTNLVRTGPLASGMDGWMDDILRDREPLGS